MSGSESKSMGWKRLVDLDVLYEWATLLIIPLYVLTTSIRSEIFVLYLIMFVLKVWRHGYRKTGLEWFFVAAVAGFAISAIGVEGGEVMKHTMRVARVICLPILMSQYKPIRRLDLKLMLIFTGLAIYGVLRFMFWPKVTGYAVDRPYAFFEFFMHSAVAAFTGYVFFLLVFLRRRGWEWKVLSLLNVAMFLYLVLGQYCRGSWVALVILTPLLLVIELKRRTVLTWAIVLLMGLLAVGAVNSARPEAFERIIDRAEDIVDGADHSMRGRFTFWKKGIEVFRENPVNGIGYRMFQKENVDLGYKEFEYAFYHAHNEIVSLLAELGIIGLLAWLAFKIKLLCVLAKHRKNLLGAFGMYVLIMLELHNIFEVYLVERTIYIWTFVIMGVCLNQSMGLSAREERPASSAPDDVAAKKVTVIVPFYNAESYLAVCIESILDSSHRNIEVLLIDDASTDGGERIASGFAAQDERIVVMTNDSNRGASYCRNRGLDKAGGEFVLFVDSDDRVSPCWIRGLVGAAVDTGADVVIGDAMRIQGAKELVYRMVGLDEEGSLGFGDIVLTDNGVIWNKLYSRQLLEDSPVRFDENVTLGEDLCFNYRILPSAKRIYYARTGYYRYNFQNAGSLMNRSTGEEQIANWSTVLDKLLEYSEQSGVMNRGAVMKVARDILLLHYGDWAGEVDAEVMNRIRRIDRLLPLSVRLKQFSRRLRKRKLGSRITDPRRESK